MTYESFSKLLSRAVQSSDERFKRRMFEMQLILSQESKKYNLTAITEPESVVSKHIADSVFCADALRKLFADEMKNKKDSETEITNIPDSLQGNDFMHGKAPAATVIDIGSGAGFPSIPISARCENFSVTALDSTQKKCDYIKKAAAALELDNISVICSRAEETASEGDFREKFDFAVARGVSRLNVLSEICIPFVKIGGFFVAMKARAADEENDEAQAGIEKLGAEFFKKIRYTLPFSEDERFLLIYRKVKSTPSAYPRKYSKITKNPL